MGGFVQINGYRCYHDICELMKQTGDAIQRDGVWCPVSDPKYVYAYRQVMYGDTIIYYYTAHKTVENMLRMVAEEKDPQKRNFGEVIMRGRLYCVVEPTQNEYADPLATMRRIIRKYVGMEYSVSETMYRIDEHSPQYYIFNVTNGNTHLYWDVEHMRALVGAICHHIDETTGQYGGIYSELADSNALVSTIRLDVYTPSQHMTLPGCINLEKPVNSHVQSIENTSMPCVSFTNGETWKRGSFIAEIPKYENKIQVYENGILERVFAEHGIVDAQPAPWLGEYHAYMPGMCSCPVIIKHSSRNIRLIRSCIHYDENRVLYTFPLIDVPQLETPPAETFDDYTSMDLNSARYTTAIQALKRVLVYDSESKKIAVKRRNYKGEIYWEYWLEKKFFESYDRYVKNHVGKTVLLKEIIKKRASEFKAQIVWIPYSWTHKPNDFGKYASCINQYPEPLEPLPPTNCYAFKQYITKMFRGNDVIAQLFILFMAMLVQKPFLKQKIHIILCNANALQLEIIFKAILNDVLVNTLYAPQFENIPLSTLYIVKNYEQIGIVSKEVNKFYVNNLYNNTSQYTVTAISVYRGPGIPTPRDVTCDIILDAEFIREPIPMDGVYDMLTTINESDYDGVLDSLVSSSLLKDVTPVDVAPNSVFKYMREVRQGSRQNIKPGIMYNTNEVYHDYELYTRSIDSTPERKHMFGKNAKSDGLIHRRVTENSRLVYKYMIPPSS